MSGIESNRTLGTMKGHMMKRFRKKPVVIEAVQFTGDVGAPEIVALDVGYFHQVGIGYCLLIPTLEGTLKAVPGDWIIRGIAGELYPCKPDIFSATYEPVEELAGVEDREHSEFPEAS